jgi:N-acetyltransferase 10
MLAHEYFMEKMPVTLNGVQAAILLCMGLQNKDLTSIKVCLNSKLWKINIETLGLSCQDTMYHLKKLHSSILKQKKKWGLHFLFSSFQDELGLEREQILSAFIKVMRKLYGHLQSVASKEMDASLPRLKEVCNLCHSRYLPPLFFRMFISMLFANAVS